MQIRNGWDVYTKIKELSSKDSAGAEIDVDTLTKELGIKKELIQEYLTALAVLDFIRFTDDSKQVFVITDLGNG